MSDSSGPSSDTATMAVAGAAGAASTERVDVIGTAEDDGSFFAIFVTGVVLLLAFFAAKRTLMVTGNDGRASQLGMFRANQREDPGDIFAKDAFANMELIRSALRWLSVAQKTALAVRLN